MINEVSQKLFDIINAQEYHTTFYTWHIRRILQVKCPNTGNELRFLEFVLTHSLGRDGYH